MASVFLVRHAPTTVTGICYGQSDVPVYPEPVEAARRIALQWGQTELGGWPQLWTSPWQRTSSVANELARNWGITVHSDPRLSELCFGDWEGREYDEIARNDAPRWQHWARNYELAAPPNGESVAQLRLRVGEWLDERRSGASTVLAVTHAGVVRTARALAGQLSYASVVGSVVHHLRVEQV